MRSPHYLPGIRSKEMPGSFIVVDTETKPITDSNGVAHHYLWFGWAVYRRRLPSGNWTSEEWFRFTTRRAFWNWVYSKLRSKTRLYLFAHNGAFDLPVLGAFSLLTDDGWKLESAVVDSPPMILSWRRETCTIKFVDTLNIWMVPLSKIGESVGIPKLPMPGKRASAKKWDRYCQRDVQVLMIALLKWWSFIRDNDLGPFAMTLASQAFTTYRYRFMPQRIFIDANSKALSVSRDSYFGGRTECWRLGQYNGPLYYVDCNSMYPSVMKACKFPYELVGVYSKPTHSEIRRWVNKYSCYAIVKINTDSPIYPVIRDNKLVFPIGTFDAVLPHPELVCALQRDHIHSIQTVAVYKDDYLFADFVEFFYNKRLMYRSKGDHLNDWLTKILMNSLYGKFGQRGRQYEIIGECDADAVRVWTELDGETDAVYRMREFGGVTQQWVEDDESRHSFPAIAASVCGYGRQTLWNAVERAGMNEVYYMDTDSLVVSETGYKRLKELINPTELGAWKLESILNRVELYGPKDYVFDGNVKIKGIRRNALVRNDGGYEQDQFTGFAGLLRSGSLEAPTVKRIVKRLKRNYTKGKVTSRGRVLPFTLCE